MSLATALLTPILGDASPWTPRRLFQLGEAGGVYDPSDLTAEKVAWRRNLLTWSEDFTNAAWTKDACTITANTATAPNGTLTADKIVSNNATAQMGVGQSFTAVAGTYTASWYVKQAEVQFVQMLWSGGASANFANVNLATGTVTAGTYTNATVTDAGSGWYRITITSTLSAGSAFAYLWLVNSGAAGRAAAYTGNGTNGALAWGAQLDLGSTATAYQRITDFTSDFLAAFPTHGLYQDAAGTTPVTALGQPVGLVIDSKTGGIAGGTERRGVGAPALLGTATAATYNTTTGAGAITRVDASNQSYVQFTGLAANAHRVIITNNGAINIFLRNTISGAIIQTVAAGATVTCLPFATGGVLIVSCNDGTTTFTVTSVLEVPGVHAIQPTSASRPLLDGRVNLLTFSEQFDNAAWTKTNGTITANAALAPDGTATADLFTENTANGTHAVVQNLVALNSTTAPYKQEFVVKANGRTRVAIQFASAASGFPAIEGRWDLTTGTLTSSGATGTAVLQGTEINALGNGYYRISVTGYTGQSGLHYAQLFMLDASGNIVYTGNGASGIFVWGADHRLAADAAYPAQRVAAATDYADVGVPRSFLFDGFDDSLYTASNMDLSGTDKVTVLAGVRKLSDAARGMLFEPASAATNRVSIEAPNGPAGNNYQFTAGGSIIAGAVTPASYASPVTNVFTGTGNIAGDQVVIRINGAQVAIGTADAGTGNYQNAVYNIGRRDNTSLPFNGKAYQLIVRGALTDAATLAQAERYVGAKTGLAI